MSPQQSEPAGHVPKPPPGIAQHLDTAVSMHWVPQAVMKAQQPCTMVPFVLGMSTHLGRCVADVDVAVALVVVGCRERGM